MNIRSRRYVPECGAEHRPSRWRVVCVSGVIFSLSIIQTSTDKMVEAATWHSIAESSLDGILRTRQGPTCMPLLAHLQPRCNWPSVYTAPDSHQAEGHLFDSPCCSLEIRPPSCHCHSRDIQLAWGRLFSAASKKRRVQEEGAHRQLSPSCFAFRLVGWSLET